MPDPEAIEAARELADALEATPPSERPPLDVDQDRMLRLIGRRV